MSAVISDIIRERARQDRKWGIQDHSDLTWLGILTEELGELAKAIIEQTTWACPDCGRVSEFNITQCPNCDHDGRTDLALHRPDNIRIKEELTQVAAVAAAWLENIKRNEETFATWIAAHNKGENR